MSESLHNPPRGFDSLYRDFITRAKLESLRRSMFAEPRTPKPLPHCCGLDMVRPIDTSVFLCARGGCHRTLHYIDWMEGRMTPKAWKPTVPHPLLQIDEELKRAGAE